jgi:hypothetical protein
VVDSSKVKEVLDWKPPTSVSEVQSLLGWLAIIDGSFQTSLRS